MDLLQLRYFVRMAELDSFKDSLRAQGAEAKTLEYINEAFGHLAERIKQLAG